MQSFSPCGWDGCPNNAKKALEDTRSSGALFLVWGVSLGSQLDAMSRGSAAGSGSGLRSGGACSGRC